MDNAKGLYDEAMASDTSLSGYYHRNVRVDGADGPVVVRAPIAGADGMDLRIWREYDVLRAVAAHVDTVPEVLHVSEEPPYQIHRFIEGDVVDAVAPRGIAVPAHVAGDVVAFFVRLTRVPFGVVPPLPASWPDSGQSTLFAHRLSDVTQGVWDEFSEPFADTYAAFEFPNDPLAAVRAAWDGLTSRPFSVLHSDVHRKNLIVRAGRTWFLDWELALWGDPVYDLAVHLHKMGYLDHEATAVRDSWLKLMPTEYTGNAVDDIETYLRHERVKSAIVDTVRYTKQVRAGAPAAMAQALAESLTAKLAMAGQVWGCGGRYTRDEVAAVLREGAGAGR